MPEGVITLLMTLRAKSRHLNLMVVFLVIKIHSTYNVILGCPCLKMDIMVVSIYHFVMKFLIEVGIKEVIGNQVVRKDYNFTAIKRKLKGKETHIINFEKGQAE